MIDADVALMVVKPRSNCVERHLDDRPRVDPDHVTDDDLADDVLETHNTVHHPA